MMWQRQENEGKKDVMYRPGCKMDSHAARRSNYYANLHLFV